MQQSPVRPRASGVGPRRRAVLWSGLVVAVAVLAVVAALLVRGGPREADLGDGTAQQTFDRHVEAAELVRRLEAALRSGDPARVTGLTAEGDRAARIEAAAIIRNTRRLPLRSVSLRYVGPSGLVGGARAEGAGDESWVVDVEVSWTYSGVHRGVGVLEVPLVLRRSEQVAVFDSVGDVTGRRAPLWLLGPLRVRRAEGVLVGGTPGRLEGLLRSVGVARREVNRVLPGWSSALVVEAPGTMADFRAAAGLSSFEARSLAAVTTTVDGSAEGTTPVHVFLSPRVFGGLGPRAQQIVLTHEATHVALGAATTRVPEWLSEGLADYVALRGSDVPVEVSAAQAVRLTRRQGPPRRLPDSVDFAAGNADLGATYEAAWLACRLIAQEHGERSLLRLYASVDSGTGVAEAFRDVLGRTEQEFTRRWQDHLRDLAR